MISNANECNVYVAATPVAILKALKIEPLSTYTQKHYQRKIIKPRSILWRSIVSNRCTVLLKVHLAYAAPAPTLTPTFDCQVRKSMTFKSMTSAAFCLLL